jgi:hypothetical protein
MVSVVPGLTKKKRGAGIEFFRSKNKKRRWTTTTKYHRNSDIEVDRYSTNVVVVVVVVVDVVVAPSYERHCGELADENPPAVRNCSKGCNQPTGTERLQTVVVVAAAAAVVANRLAVLPAPAGISGVAGGGGGFGLVLLLRLFLDGPNSRD